MKKKRRPSKRTLKKWYNMTQGNFHGEVRLAIAEYFGDSICPDLSEEGYGNRFVNAFRKINEIHEKEGSLNHELGEARELLTKYMEEQIRKVYGQSVADDVHNCL